ncbi:MAG: hypothetical protein HRT45_10885 [Bdellovibrionales bacterium]|nr:hypothetical protein [Bdellovibrionales bacterium]
MLFTFILLLLSTLSCTGEHQLEKAYLLPWSTPEGDYKLQPVHIKTMSSQYEVSGPAADVYLGNDISNRGFIGDKARPRLNSGKGLFVPLDVESSMSLVIYAHMERLKSFDRQMGMAKNLRWPRQVGLQTEFVDSDGAVETNNAIYLYELDSVAFFPMELKALPMAINGAVLAHEHFHSHFNAFNLRQVESGSSYEEFNEAVILRGWNEGLADFYAYVYTGQSDFISLSIPDDDTRALNVQPLVIRPGKNLQAVFNRYMNAGKNRIPKERRRGRVLSCLSYPLGTQIAVFLYHMSNLGDVGSDLADKHSVLKLVMDRLSSYEGVLAQNVGPLAPTDILEFIFEDKSLLSQAQLDLLEKTVLRDSELVQPSEWIGAYPCER